MRGAARPAVLLLSTALTLPVVLGALASPAEAVTSTPAEATATATPAEVVTERVVSDPAISESSGLAPSLLHRGVLWTHNDSGHDPVLYALARDGSTTARFTVTGVRGRDWEAVQTLRDRHGRALVAVADTGNNEGNHETVDVVLVREPTVLRARTGGSLRPLTTVRLRYPDGPADCEALLCRGMGQGAYQSMLRVGIKPMVTDISEIEQAVLAYVAGRLVDHTELLH